MLWVIFFAAIASATELQKQNARLLRTNKILLQTLQKISSETAVGMGQNAQVSGSKPKCEDISIMDGYLTCGGLNEMFNGDICKYDYGAPGAPCSCMCGSDFICEGKACGECLDNTDYACTFYDGKCISSESMKDPSGFKMSKFVWNSDNCPTEKSVGFNPFASKCSKRNDCIYDCQEADSSKTKYDCMKECPKSLCEEEKAVGGSWENGKCMSFGSYLNFDSGAVVQDMGTGWSESSCQSECDSSSTTKACQYEFWTQTCSMIYFHTNEIYGAGDHDALCYVK